MKARLLSLAISFSILLCLGPTLSSEALGASSDRNDNLSKIRTFLLNKKIASSIEKENGIKVDALMKRIDSLSDEQIRELAQNTPDIIKLGGDTTNVESKTAERMSKDWMAFADKWLMIGLILSVVLVLLVL